MNKVRKQVKRTKRSGGDQVEETEIESFVKKRKSREGVK